MSLAHKNLGEIVEPDLQALVTNSVREGTRLDYKLVLPGSADDDKRELLGG